MCSDVGMLSGAGGAPVISAMGALLPAVAAACEGHENGGGGALGSGRSLGGVSSSRLSYGDIARSQKEEGGLIKVGVCC